MANRSVFTLAAILMVLFFLVSNYDRYFFLIHFFGSLIYVVMLLLLFYGLEEWAYAMGFVTPLLWIMLMSLAGTLVASLRGLGQLLSSQAIRNPLDVLAGLVLVAGLALMAASGRAFWREVWGRPGAVRAAVLATAVVGAYYAVLIAAYLQMARPAT